MFRSCTSLAAFSTERSICGMSAKTIPKTRGWYRGGVRWFDNQDRQASIIECDILAGVLYGFLGLGRDGYQLAGRLQVVPARVVHRRAAALRDGLVDAGTVARLAGLSHQCQRLGLHTRSRRRVLLCRDTCQSSGLLHKTKPTVRCKGHYQA